MAESDFYDVYEDNPLRNRASLALLETAVLEKRGVLLRRSGRHWNPWWCVLLVSSRKLQFFESEDANMSSQLELAGARIRTVTMPEGSEPQFVFEIYTPRWDRTLEALACTSKRDLQQWLRAFTEFMIEGVPRSPRRGFSSFNFRALREALSRRWFSSSVSMRQLRRKAATTAEPSAKYPERHTLSSIDAVKKERALKFDGRKSTGDIRDQRVESSTTLESDEVQFWMSDKASHRSRLESANQDADETKTEINPEPREDNTPTTTPVATVDEEEPSAEVAEAVDPKQEQRESEQAQTASEALTAVSSASEANNDDVAVHAEANAEPQPEIAHAAATAAETEAQTQDEQPDETELPAESLPTIDDDSEVLEEHLRDSEALASDLAPEPLFEPDVEQAARDEEVATEIEVAADDDVDASEGKTLAAAVFNNETLAEEGRRESSKEKQQLDQSAEEEKAEQEAVAAEDVQEAPVAASADAEVESKQEPALDSDVVATVAAATAVTAVVDDVDVAPIVEAAEHADAGPSETPQDAAEAPLADNAPADHTDEPASCDAAQATESEPAETATVVVDEAVDETDKTCEEPQPADELAVESEAAVEEQPTTPEIPAVVAVEEDNTVEEEETADQADQAEDAAAAADDVNPDANEPEPTPEVDAPKHEVEVPAGAEESKEAHNKAEDDGEEEDFHDDKPTDQPEPQPEPQDKDQSDLPDLATCKASLEAAMARLLDGDGTAQAEVHHWEEVLCGHPEYQREHEAKVEAWEKEQKQQLRDALYRMRELVPPDVCVSSVSKMQEEGLPRACALRIFQTKALWLIRMRPIDIQKIHVADLFIKYACQGLDIKELRAVYAVLPRWFLNDPDGKREEWRLTFQLRLQSLTAKEQAGTLAGAEKRNNAYRRCKKVCLYDHHTLYVQRVVKSGVGQTYQPYDYADPIQEVETSIDIPDEILEQVLAGGDLTAAQQL